MRPSHRFIPRYLPIAAAAAIVGVTAAAAVLSPPPAGAQNVPPAAGRAAHMQQHFSQVLTIHEAVIRGDLPAIRAPATWLAEHDAPTALPAGSAPYVAEMRRAARRTAHASTVLEAALGTADMLKTCGDCHRGIGTMPSTVQPPTPTVGGVVGHMLAHQHAVDQMMQGLIVPSSTSWRAGADAFTAAPLRPEALPADPKLTREITASEKRIHLLAAAARTVEAPAARAVSYAQIIARCADCHAVHQKVWGPDRR